VIHSIISRSLLCAYVNLASHDDMTSQTNDDTMTAPAVTSTEASPQLDVNPNTVNIIRDIDESAEIALRSPCSHELELEINSQMVSGASPAFSVTDSAEAAAAAASFFTPSPKQLLLMAVERLDSETSALREANERLQSEVSSLRRENADLRRQLDDVIDEQRLAEERRSKADEQRSKAEETNNRLNAELERLRAIVGDEEEMKGCHRRTAELETRVGELEQQLIAERSDRDRLERELADLRRSRSQQKRNRQTNDDNHAASDVGGNGGGGDSSSSSSRNSKRWVGSKDRQLEMALEIDALRSERDGLRMTGDRMSTTCGMLEAEVARLRAIVADREAELERESVRHGLLTRQFNSLLGENERLKHRYRVQTSTTSLRATTSSSMLNLSGSASTTSESLIIAGGGGAQFTGGGSMVGSKASSDGMHMPRSITWSSSLSSHREDSMTTGTAVHEMMSSLSSLPHRELQTSSFRQQLNWATASASSSSLPLMRQTQHQQLNSFADSRLDVHSKTTIAVNSDHHQQPNNRSPPTHRQRYQQPVYRQRKPTFDDANTTSATAAVGNRSAAVDGQRRPRCVADQSRQTAVKVSKTTHTDGGGCIPRRFDRHLPVPTTRLRTSGAAAATSSASAEAEDDAMSTSSSSTASSSSATSDGSTLPAIDKPMTLMGASMETGKTSTTSGRLPPRQMADCAVPLKVKRPPNA
jgi:hypothetical protein